jgi:hypothetical protein
MARLRIVEAKRSWVERLFGLVVLAMFTVGVVAVVAVTWRIIPNHALALGALVVLIPLVLWGLTQDDGTRRDSRSATTVAWPWVAASWRSVSAANSP